MALDNEPATDSVAETASNEAAASNPAESAPAKDQAETPAAPSTDGPADAQDDKPEKFQESPAFRRIQRQRANAERRAMRAEAEAEALRTQLRQQSPAPQQSGATPKASDFASYDDYVAYLAEVKANRAAERAVGAVTQSLTAERAQAEQQATLRAFMSEAGKQAKAAGVNFDDAWEAITDESIPVSRDVAEYLFEAADNKALLVDHFAKNTDELERISGLSRAMAVKELARLDARLGAKPKPNVTKAPPPVPTLGGRVLTTQDPSKMSMDEYYEHRMAQIRAKR